MEDDSTLLTADSGRLLDLDAHCLEHPCLVVVAGPATGRRYRLDRPRLIIGRKGGVDIHVADRNVSRHHAELIVDGETVTLRDNLSTNGTCLNGKKIAADVQLQRHDSIRVGHTVLKFVPKGEIEDAYLDKLEAAASRDALTGLLNRGHFMQILESELAAAQEMKGTLSLLLLDIDSFKVINDTYGHSAGDRVLVEVSQLVRASLEGSTASAGRYGGEEILVILPGTDGEAAVEQAERLRAAVENARVDYDNDVLRVTVSIGVSDTEGKYVPEELFRRADRALYEAKTGGRNRVRKN